MQVWIILKSEYESKDVFKVCANKDKANYELQIAEDSRSAYAKLKDEPPWYEIEVHNVEGKTP